MGQAARTGGPEPDAGVAWRDHLGEVLIDTSDDLVVVLDQDGTVVFSNDGHDARRLARERAEVGASILDLVHPDDANLASDTFLRGVLADADVEPVVLRVRSGDGEWALAEARLHGSIDVPGRAAGHVVTMRDVTERERHRAETDATRRMVEVLVADLDEILVVLDPSLKVRWASPGVERLVDAPAYTNVNESAFNDIHPDDLGRVTTAVEEVMARSEARARLGFRLKHERHGWRSVEATLVNRLDDPAVEGIVCTLRDVTGQREPDAELRRLHEHDREEMARLRETDQLKDAFLATVTHEMRTPLTAVRGFAGFLLDHRDSIDPDTMFQLIERISVNAVEMDDMIAQLLDFSRLQAGAIAVQLEPTELGAVVDEMMTRLEPHLADHVVERGPCEFVVNADHDGIRHVLRNLLTNAARYSRAGSRIRIWAERGDGEVLLHVADEGIGIAARDVGKIFQSFYQAAPASTGRRGTGIGLNVARRFAQLQEGRLGVQSEVGKGSTFTLALPLAEGH